MLRRWIHVALSLEGAAVAIIVILLIALARITHSR
jgi:hypothetical protein